MTDDFTDDIAIVTGGTRGIGRGITKRFAKAGATVVATYYDDEESAAEMETILAEYDVEYDVVQFDVADYEATKAAIDGVADEFGAPTILVNNAGVMGSDVLFRMEKADWDRVLEVNLDGAFNCTKAATEYMRREHEGAIVNVSSMAGLRGYSAQASYCASKSGLIGFTKAVAREYARHGIRSNAVAFGYVDTELLETDGIIQFADRDELTEKIPQGRIPDPDEVSGVVAFLASDDANYVTGEVIRADGGRLS